MPCRSSAEVSSLSGAAPGAHRASRVCQLPLLFCAGMVVGYYALPLHFGPHSKLLVLVVVCTTCAFGFVLRGSPNNLRGSPFAALAAGLLIGTLCVETVVLTQSSCYFGFPVQAVSRFGGRALGDSSRVANGGYMTRFAVDSVVRGDGQSTSARAEVLVLSSPDASFSAGEKASLKAGIRELTLSGSAPEGRSGPILYTATVASSGIQRDGWVGDINRIRSRAVGAVLRVTARTGDAAGPLLQALLTGNRDNLDPLVSRQFRRAGCAHILALSGMHLGILTALVSLLFSRFFNRRAAFAVGLLFIVGFVWIAGAKPSLVRAALMFAVAGYANIRGRRTTPEAILSVCFGMQLLLAPESAMELSFQLSYLAIAGVLFAAPIVVRIASHCLTPQAAALVGAGVGAQFAVLPLVAGSFGEAFPIGLAAGIVLGPLVTLFIWSGLSTVVLSLVGGLVNGTADRLHFAATVVRAVERIAIAVTESLAKAMSAVVDAAATVPGIRLGIGTALSVSLCSIILLLLSERWFRRRGLSGTGSNLGPWLFPERSLKPVGDIVDARDDR